MDIITGIAYIAIALIAAFAFLVFPAYLEYKLKSREKK